MSRPSPSVRVCAIIPAYGRPQLLARALASLVDQGAGLAEVIVVNNSSDPETARVATAAGGKVRLLDYGCNLGTAGGIGAGLREFLQDAVATHAWILDDDACATPGALTAMLEAATRAEADLVAPLLLDETGEVRWFPGPLPQPMWNCIRRNPRPAELWRECGAAPQACRWAYWASLLISRRAVETVGLPRMDLWSQFTDMEYTLRVTTRFRAVLAPRAQCLHLPPPETAEEKGRKIFMGLRAASYGCVWLPHGRRALRHLPGMYFRALRAGGWRPAAWDEARKAFLRGAVLGRTPAADTFREAFRRAEKAFPDWGGPESN